MAAAGIVPQIPVNFGHERSREARQMKEDDEGIPFHTLLTAGTHRGDRISIREGAAVRSVRAAVPLQVTCSWAAQGACRAGQGHAGRGRRGAGRGRARTDRLAMSW
jgi:hypothetical protein